ncbi:hypothetical protein HAX54_030392, partial [Datura stramonium]|nr:hypothetical protein [Datura stramonium]
MRGVDSGGGWKGKKWGKEAIVGESRRSEEMTTGFNGGVVRPVEMSEKRGRGRLEAMIWTTLREENGGVMFHCMSTLTVENREERVRRLGSISAKRRIGEKAVG